MLLAFARNGNPKILATAISELAAHVTRRSELIPLIDEIILASDGSEDPRIREAINASLEEALRGHSEIDDDIDHPSWASKTMLAPAKAYAYLLQGMSRSRQGRLSEDLMVMLKANGRHPVQEALELLGQLPSLPKWGNFAQIRFMLIGHLFNPLPLVRGHAAHAVGNLPYSEELRVELVRLFSKPSEEILAAIRYVAGQRCLSQTADRLTVATDGLERPYELWFTDATSDVYSYEDEQHWWMPPMRTATLELDFSYQGLASGLRIACTCDVYAASNLICAARCQALGALYKLAASAKRASAFLKLADEMSIRECRIQSRVARYFSRRLQPEQEESIPQDLLLRFMSPDQAEKLRPVIDRWQQISLMEISDICLKEELPYRATERLIAYKANPLSATGWMTAPAHRGRPVPFSATERSGWKARNGIVLDRLKAMTNSRSDAMVFRLIKKSPQACHNLRSGRRTVTLRLLLAYYRAKAISREELNEVIQLLFR